MFTKNRNCDFQNIAIGATHTNKRSKSSDILFTRISSYFYHCRLQQPLFNSLTIPNLFKRQEKRRENSPCKSLCLFELKWRDFLHIGFDSRRLSHKSRNVHESNEVHKCHFGAKNSREIPNPTTAKCKMAAKSAAKRFLWIKMSTSLTRRTDVKVMKTRVCDEKYSKYANQPKLYAKLRRNKAVYFYGYRLLQMTLGR